MCPDVMSIGMPFTCDIQIYTNGLDCEVNLTISPDIYGETHIKTWPSVQNSNLTSPVITFYTLVPSYTLTATLVDLDMNGTEINLIEDAVVMSSVGTSIITHDTVTDVKTGNDLYLVISAITNGSNVPLNIDFGVASLYTSMTLMDSSKTIVWVYNYPGVYTITVSPIGAYSTSIPSSNLILNVTGYFL
jgi:hypothetical protein